MPFILFYIVLRYCIRFLQLIQQFQGFILVTWILTSYSPVRWPLTSLKLKWLSVRVQGWSILTCNKSSKSHSHPDQFTSYIWTGDWTKVLVLWQMSKDVPTRLWNEKAPTYVLWTCFGVICFDVASVFSIYPSPPYWICHNIPPSKTRSHPRIIVTSHVCRKVLPIYLR